MINCSDKLEGKMKTIKNTLLFLTSFIIVGLFVLLIDQLYPTPSIDQAALQTYPDKNLLSEVGK